jgi:hypothetical protein
MALKSCLVGAKKTFAPNNTGCPKKNETESFFVFVIQQLNIHPILKILVSTPHNNPLIMGGRRKNFEDWMNIELLNYDNKKISVSFFLGHPV